MSRASVRIRRTRSGRRGALETRRTTSRTEAAGAPSAAAARSSSAARCSSSRSGAFLLVNSDRFQRTLEEVTLPLRHEDIIRQQAADKDVPAGPDRRGDLLRVPLPRPDLARRRARSDADHAEPPRS